MTFKLWTLKGRMMIWQIQSSSIHSDDKHTFEERIMRYLIGSDIEQPSNLRQVIEDNSFPFFFFHFFTNPLNFLLHCMTSPSLMQIYLSHFIFRSVFPYIVNQIVTNRYKINTFLFENLYSFFSTF